MAEEQIRLLEPIRLLGHTSGLVSALVALKVEIGRFTQDLENIPLRHTRKRASAQIKVSTLQTIYGKIEKDLRRLQAIWEERENSSK